jgi:hypothetical protein
MNDDSPVHPDLLDDCIDFALDERLKSWICKLARQKKEGIVLGGCS